MVCFFQREPKGDDFAVFPAGARRASTRRAPKGLGPRIGPFTTASSAGAYDTDSQFGGLLFLFDPSAKRYKLELGGPVIPRFQAGASL